MSIITRIDQPDLLSQYTWVFEDISRKRAAKAKASRRSQAEKQASPPKAKKTKNAAPASGGVSSRKETSQPSLAELQREAYSRFRSHLITAHNEHLLGSITKTVTALRQTGINIYCVNGYDQLLALITGQGRGCFVTRSAAGDVDVWLDAADCLEIAQSLDIPRRAALEAMLLHEVGHIQVTAMLPKLGHPQTKTELLMAEHFGWSAAESFHQSIGRCSRADFEAVRRYCLDAYLNS